MNPRHLYRTAQFLTSAALLAQAPPDQGFEVAFTGRSNAGKSSAINVLCDQNRLTRTSKTPGRTQLINFFQLDAERRLWIYQVMAMPPHQSPSSNSGKIA